MILIMENGKSFSNLNFDENWTPDWKATYGCAAKCTKSTKLVKLQYGFLHRILPSNVFLTKIGIKEDQNLLFQ